MSLIKWSNFDDAFPLFPSRLEDFFRNTALRNSMMSELNMPAANIEDTKDAVSITLAVPGLKKEDCVVEVHDGVLTVSSERKEEKNEKDADGMNSRYEYNYSSFSRSFVLPKNANPDAIKAKFEDGELRLTLPKTDVALPSARQIAIE